MNGGGLVDVRTETVSKTWRKIADSPGWPYVHFIAKSNVKGRDPATV